MKKFREMIIAMVLVFCFVGGMFFGKWLFKENTQYYLEAKHQYDYCPYCGEYIGK